MLQLRNVCSTNFVISFTLAQEEAKASSHPFRKYFGYVFVIVILMYRASNNDNAIV